MVTQRSKLCEGTGVYNCLTCSLDEHMPRLLRSVSTLALATPSTPFDHRPNPLQYILGDALVCTGFRMALRRGKGKGLALATPFPPFRSRPESSLDRRLEQGAHVPAHVPGRPAQLIITVWQWLPLDRRLEQGAPGPMVARCHDQCVKVTFAGASGTSNPGSTSDMPICVAGRSAGPALRQRPSFERIFWHRAKM